MTRFQSKIFTDQMVTSLPDHCGQHWFGFKDTDKVSEWFGLTNTDTSQNEKEIQITIS